MILHEPKVLVKMDKLYKSFKPGNEQEYVLKDANIRIMQGEFVIIKGISGTQKNVFFNLIGCLEKPSAGKYYFDYEDVALSDKEALDRIRKHKIGYVFRNFNLVADLTVIENIEIPMHGLSISKQDKNDRLSSALRHFNIEAIAGEKAGRLSDFQKQLVSLARAIINKPLLIIADEPAANLGGREEEKLMEYLVQLNQEGTSIMLITGKEEFKVLSSFRVISVESGRVAGGEA